MHRLPYDVQLSIFRLLSVRDVVRVCATCRALQELMGDRTIWHRALLRILARFPQPQLFRRLPTMGPDELRASVLRSARLDRLWHAPEYRPRQVTDYHCDRTVEHVSLVAGGTWLVIVRHDGSLQLHELGAPQPTATFAHAPTEDESVFYLSSRLSLSGEHEDLIILQMGVRYNQCNIYAYHVATTGPAPTLVPMGRVSVTGSVWCCASGGRLLVYGLESGGGDMVLHVCRIGASRPQLALNIGPWS
ncbi:uncharacterized protein BXZ73DRAFT_28309, partial [Epithele typhae]|uniref:uncharacterized protein n=1 Tax=Epithele typhae TaxID=378194 RepID=UPI0020081DA1